MFGRKPADGVGGGSSANAQSTPPARKGFAAGLFGTSATPRSAPGASKPAPRTPQADLRDDDLPGMFTRATTLLENVQRRVSASSGAQGAKGSADDADNARQFMRVNEVKRLTTRIRAGVVTLADAGEKGAWEAQLSFLESETATAVEAVLSVASPAPAETRPSERRNETTTGEAKTNMFAGLNVSPAPPTTTTQSRMQSASPSPVSPSPKSAVTGVPSTSAATPAPAPTASLALGGGDGGLFSGLDVSPAPRPVSPGTRTSTGTRTSSGTPPPPPQPPASPGISIEPPPPPLDASAFSTPATTVPSSPTTETEPPAAPTGSAAERDGTGSAAPSPGPKRRPRVRVGYARNDDAARGLGVEQPTIPAGGNDGSGARAETRARPDVDDAKALEADPLEREMSQKAEVVRKWKAAVVIQSRYRGRRGRAAVSKMLAAMAAATAAQAQADLERAAAASRAATRIQAAHRARAARAEVQKMRSAAKAAAAAKVAAEAEIRAAEAAEAAAAAEEEAAEAEAAEHRVREAAASRIQAALRGRTARFEVSRRRVAAAAARAAAAQAEVEEQRARDAAATRIQSARRARAARVEFEKRRNAARLADSLTRDESIFDAADANKGKAASINAVADRSLAESMEGRNTERRMSGDDGDDVPASLKKTTDEEDAGTSEAAAEAGTDDETGSVLDMAATLGVAAAAAAATEFLEHTRVPLKGADAVETLANTLDRAAAALSHAAREARRCVGAAEPEPAAEARGATPPNPGGAAAPPSFDLMSF